MVTPPGARTALFRRRVRDFMQPSALVLAAETPVGEAVRRMAAEARTGVLVVDGEGRIAGILTERDVTRRIALAAVPGAPLAAFATRPVETVAADEFLYRAVARMRRHGLRHLPVVDGAGRPIGMVNLIDAIGALAEETLDHVDKLSGGSAPAASESGDCGRGPLAAIKAAEAGVASDLLAERVPAAEILSLITDVNLDLHRRVLADAERSLAESGWGPPPAPCTLLVMGSGGRGENLLAPDQDNGFILADYPDEAHARIDPWFVALAERFNAGLAEIGFALCKGNIMARNPVWRKTASQWRDQTTLWARRRSPVAVLFADIFFDFRAASGPEAPAAALRAHVTETLKAYPALLGQMARDHVGRRVALGFADAFLAGIGGGGIRTEQSGAQAGRADLKLGGLMPLVASVRLWALKHGVPETGTLARLAALKDAGLIAPADAAALAEAFEHLATALLRQQLADAAANRPVGNHLDPKTFSRRDRADLVQSLRVVERFRHGTYALFAGGVG